MRNKAGMIGCAAALLIAGFVAQNVISSRFGRPTTKGMDSYEVINAYYDAFSVLDHTFMEACIWGADKIDIDVAINYYVIYKVRQANEIKTGPLIVSAKVWKERGGELPAPDVFGITGLSIIHLSGNEDESRINYRVNYTLWFPNETVPSIRSDELTLMRNKKRNWQIIEIERTIK
ncbi:MAG: hypothetical protein LBG91_04125 [Treponema sp.]|nr:hypothetical protein [Treponema sp.]